MTLRLGLGIDEAELRRIKRYLHLQWHKWDTQVGDTDVLSAQPLILARREWEALCSFAESLAAETVRLEAAVFQKPHLWPRLGVPRALRDVLLKCNPEAQPMRTMRFDFHLTDAGWRISEVNSDVPGGWSEGTSLPLLYLPFFNTLERPPSPLEAWREAVQAAIQPGRVALLSAAGYLEDEQVVRAFAHALQGNGIATSMIQSPAAIERDTQGRCALRASGESVGLIVRFYQAEWLSALAKSTGWERLFENSMIPVVNPAIAVLSESKRFPLAFDDFPIEPVSKTLLPECRDPRDVHGNWDDWVLKGCYSNTGDRVYICGSLTQKERQRVVREAMRKPLRWIAQKRFETRAVESCRGPLYPCVGVFVVNGRAAGAYARLSRGPVTNHAAIEAPVLIERA